ncbi:hypothetical protein GOP47_0004876 [Adiantum capillus-veneris]|uniref:Uncharacterized protein n=1 Tax=Adiantum capillus-veneris TaxID=13818 RepID=A0A9D4V4U1_ADICA|nr:hypothetical protein GOP47_0004876 [Adiantum capillus-veneris]
MQHERHHRQSSTPPGRSTRETLPQPPAPPSVPPPPPMRTCIGSLGVTCDILPDGAILQLGAGIALKRWMQDICSSYLKQVHIPWDDQHEDDKKYVIDTLETERSMGQDGVTSGWSSKCANSWVIDAMQHGAIEMCLRINFPQQKEAARKRVALRHTSRLGWMGRDGFVATFMKDYGRAPTAQEIEYATYCGYRALCQTLTDTPYPLEQHGEADMIEKRSIGEPLELL